MTTKIKQGGGRKPIYKIPTFITGDIDLHTQNIIKPHELGVSNKDSRMSTYHTEKKCGKITRSVVILSWQIHNPL
jgi:hypothetical protein